MKISCIIPAYNEGKRIAQVLDVATKHPDFAQVIVVDDGSLDDTASIARAFPITLISYKKNRGKSYAVQQGLKTAKHNWVCFLDADLQGLTLSDITNLTAPIKQDRADVSISLRGNAPWFSHWFGIDYISGERVYHKKYLPVNALDNKPSFAIEPILNKNIIDNNLRVAIVRWPGVRSPFKIEKQKSLLGLWSDIKFIYTLFTTTTIVGPFYQFFKLRSMRIKPLPL